MTKAKEIIEYLDKEFPENLKESWDFTEGLLEGNTEKEVKKILVNLELRENLLDKNADMLILHHPPKFGKEKTITNPFYDKLKNDPVIYSLHSRFDKTGKVNEEIAKTIFNDFEILKILDDGTIIIILKKAISYDELITVIKQKLDLPFLKTLNKKENIQKIAIHGGEGFNQHHVDKAIKENIDVYLAGDLTHHLAEHAAFYDVLFVDIEHISEQAGMKYIAELLAENFKDCEIEFVKQKSFWNYEK